MQPARRPSAEPMMKGHGDDAVDVDAHQQGHVRVLRRRPHGHAHARALHQIGQSDHHQRGETTTIATCTLVKLAPPNS
jgi:hypothetical protein